MSVESLLLACVVLLSGAGVAVNAYHAGYWKGREEALAAALRVLEMQKKDGDELVQMAEKLLDDLRRVNRSMSVEDR